MSRKWLLFPFCLAITLVFYGQLTRARGGITINESAARFLMQNSSASVMLAVINSAGENVKARIRIEILDEDNKVKATADQSAEITQGASTLTVKVPFDPSKLKPNERRRVIWYRLHYRVMPDRTDFTLAEGVVSLSEIAPDLFEVRLATSEMIREGGAYFARVQAIHPVTCQPIEHVAIEADVTLDDDNNRSLKLRAGGVTDSRGYVRLTFPLPPRFPQYPHTSQPAGGELHVIARLNGLVAEITTDVLVDQFARFLISTDKPLYQPGQTLHVRALTFSPSKHALTNQDIRIRITDPENMNLFRAVARSSRFGIANADWTIPENARLGDYRIWVGVDGSEDSADIAYDVRISRYDLPNFAVSVATDRKYYLPGQNAIIKVRADYLFGQPVKSGHVRVIRELEREWNYAEQKWDIDEGDKYEGETDADGFFRVPINLADDQEKLSDNDYSRFKDVSYAAYFTDATTKRTEQRRFDLRITREAIHVYVISKDYYESRNRNLPLTFYISANYADGSPAASQASVELAPESDNNVQQSSDIPRHLLTTIRTNRYGLAKVTGLRLPRDLRDQDELDLSVSVRDAKGQTGSKTERLSIDDEDAVVVETEKTIYRTGEPIDAVVTSSSRDLTVLVDVVRDSSVIRSEKVQLHNGRGSITFPYRPDFKDVMTIAAYQDFADSRRMIDTRTILYPHDQELKVTVNPSGKSYRPGQDAQLNLQVRTAAGRPAEGALGVVMFDKAVDERSRTDLQFGHRVSNFNETLERFLGLDNQIAGLSLRDLRRADLSKPVPADLELAAEVLLNQSRDYLPRFDSSEQYETDPVKIFGEMIRSQLHPVEDALSSRYSRTREYPHDEAGLRRLLSESGIALAELRDPWSTRYRPGFSVDKQSDVLTLISAGPDKQFDTSDDFSVERMAWLYFRSMGEAIDRSVREYHERTGGFIHDGRTLRSEVQVQGFDIDTFRDRWDRPYRFEFDVEQVNYVIKVRSGGPDQQFEKDPKLYSDDFRIWTSSIDYFAGPRAQINLILNQQLRKTNRFPNSDQALRETLRSSGVILDDLSDPWSHPYYLVFKVEPFYADRVQLENRGQFAGRATQQMQITPVTSTAIVVNLRSVGPDGRRGTLDDFEVATFAGVVSAQTSQDVQPRFIGTPVAESNTSGAITGLVTDANGAAIPGVDITAWRSDDQKYATRSNEEGKYELALPPGLYTIRFDSTGFTPTVITDVLVRWSNLLEVNVSLQPGATMETVTVTAGGVSIQTESAQNSSNVVVRQLSQLRGANVVTKSGISQQTSTPRLREYFPETLVWQPSLETDKQGRAQLKFKLADNITTWKMSVIGSTEDGRIGTVEKEIKSFQPFFVEHDPPRILTEGDEISLPVVVRNYLDHAQAVSLEIKPESWFALLGPTTKSVNVPAGDAGRGTFDFRASASVKDGKQRITATGADANDAIEKPITVHPDGEEKSVTASDVVGEGSTLTLNIPNSLVPNSARSEVKIYPNLMAHVAESVEAIMERPYGCGEQTISSTYPSLLLLRNYKKSGQDSPLRGKAERYLHAGYARLLNYRDSSGGFTYWGHGDPDIALTAYALRFLSEAKQLIAVDDEAISGARAWLIRQQRADGSWAAHNYDQTVEDKRRTALLTAYISRVLALTGSGTPIDVTAGKPDPKSPQPISAELKSALDYLTARVEEIDEPYLIASYALAALDAGERERGQKAIDKLRSLAHEENGANYWSLETNTPFYGWGLAGRVETTALVVQALARYESSTVTIADGAELFRHKDKLINRGLLFLLRAKDRYGVWYSTQATINVLDALLVLLARDVDAVATGTMPVAEIVVNGRSVKTVNLPSTGRLAAPITIDLNGFIHGGANQIEIKRSGGSSPASVQAVTTYYLPWAESIATQNENWRANKSSGLRLLTRFDKTETKVSEEINCHVEAERIGFSGYGMMLAEIGLPPGADVDRASLDAAMKGSDFGISQYDILPDRVVVYLWSRAGGTKFDFKFRPRFGLRAQTAASLVYDYYNPEARAIVAPARFIVK
jgi:hypothetical protein